MSSRRTKPAMSVFTLRKMTSEGGAAKVGNGRPHADTGYLTCGAERIRPTRCYIFHSEEHDESRAAHSPNAERITAMRRRYLLTVEGKSGAGWPFEILAAPADVERYRADGMTILARPTRPRSSNSNRCRSEAGQLFIAK